MKLRAGTLPLFSAIVLIAAFTACTRNPDTVTQVVPTLAVLNVATVTLPEATIAPTSTPVFTATQDTSLITREAELSNTQIALAATQTALVPSETPLPSTTPIPAVTLPPTLSAAAQGWVVSRQVSPLDDSVTVVIEHSADTPVHAWLSNPTPTLILRCKSGVFEIYINAGTTFDSSTENSDQTQAYVDIRWDHDAATAVAMGEATSNDAVFFSDALGTLRTMAKHNVLVFGFVPYNAGETATTFQLVGLYEVIQPLLDACHLPAIG